jgi:hypothetical protein
MHKLSFTTNAATAATAEHHRQVRKRLRAPIAPPGWLTTAELISRGYFGSTASVDRACARPMHDNPLPRPARDRVTNTRYWRVEEAEDWLARERERIAARLVLPNLIDAVQRNPLPGLPGPHPPPSQRSVYPERDAQAPTGIATAPQSVSPTDAGARPMLSTCTQRIAGTEQR